VYIENGPKQSESTHNSNCNEESDKANLNHTESKKTVSSLDMDNKALKLLPPGTLVNVIPRTWIGITITLEFEHSI